MKLKKKFFDRHGEEHEGIVIKEYISYEGDYRIILRTKTHKEYRCVEDENGVLHELVI